MSGDAAAGTIAWHDLTVPDANAVRDFYAAVAGWKPEPVDMGGYSDFNMIPLGGGPPAAGVCWRRGVNSDLPVQWLMYIVVPDVDAAAVTCRQHGGEVIVGARDMGPGRFCVIRDPAGAVCALYTSR